MTTYAFANRGVGMPYGAPHDVAFKININIPDMIANQPLDAVLPATGFAANDVLQIFEVPAGFLLKHVGVRVTTAEGGACTAAMGNASATQTHLLTADADGYMATTTINLNSVATSTVLVASVQLGGNTTEGVVFVTDGTIDITFETAATAVAVFDVWAAGWKVF